MRKQNQLRNTLFWLAVVSFSSNSAAFIDPEEWKWDKWGKWDEWDGPPDMKKWRTDQWGGDMDQWGMMPNSDRRMPWEMRSGNMPWQGSQGWGTMPWGGNRGGWGNMPWGGNRGNWGNMPWQGGNQWQSGPWNNPPAQWRQPAPGYYPYPAPAPTQRQQYRGDSADAYRAEPGRYPTRPDNEHTETPPPSTAPSK